MPVNNALTPEGSNALGAAFGYYPQLKKYRQFNDPQASVEMPLQFMRGRLAGTVGMPSDIMNMFRSPMPMEMYGQTDYASQQQVPYGSQELMRTLPLPPQGPAQQLAGNVGAVVPLSPAEILQTARIARQAALAGGKVAQKGARLVGEELNAAMLGERQGTMLGAITPQPMFAVPPSIAREGSPIQSAVVLVGDKIFTGRTHGDALNRAVYEGTVRKEGGKYIYPKGAEVNSDLFMTNSGQIIDRLQASKMFDVGASETAIEKGLMQNKPPSSMTVDSYMQQAKELKQQKATFPVENTGLPNLQIDGKVLPVTMHKLEEKAGNQIVNINPETFDKAFSKTQWQYVGKGGEGGIEGRYKGFENWIKDAKSMTASNVSVNKDGGIVFGDGRHRYAVLRDMGLDKLPISMDKDSIRNAKKFGYIADETSFQYPQQEALRLAQERASLPVEQGGLGLPKNNTPEMRAQAMGFDVSAYHGTNKDFSAFDKTKRGTATDAGWYGSGEYSSPSASGANAYAMTDFPNYKESANIMPLLIRNPESVTNTHGYVTEYVTREPEQLRSRFAAFDPFRKDVATATAMGVLAPDLLAAQQDPYSQNEMRKFMRQGR